MVIVFSLTFSVGWLGMIYFANTLELKVSIFAIMGNIVGMIAQAYFNRMDRAQDSTSTSTVSVTTPEPPKPPEGPKDAP